MSNLNATLEEFTSPSPITATPDESLAKIKELMQTNGIRHVPIVVDNKVVGIISQRDLKVAMMVNGTAELKAKYIMVEDVLSLPLDTSLEGAAFEMSKRKVGSLVVEEGDSIYGIFTSTDALNALVEIVRDINA